MSNRVYDILKFLAMVVLPAVATLYASLGKIWQWPLVSEITATICAIDTFLGAILGISSANYAKAQEADEHKPPDAE